MRLTHRSVLLRIRERCAPYPERVHQAQKVVLMSTIKARLIKALSVEGGQVYAYGGGGLLFAVLVIVLLVVLLR